MKRKQFFLLIKETITHLVLVDFIYEYTEYIL